MGKSEKGFQEEYQDRTVVEHEIMRCLIGSQAYGTAMPGSDEDFKGIFVPHQDSVLGIRNGKPVKRFGKDDQSFAVRHFATLAMKNTPNMLELLFCEDNCVVLMEPEGKTLRDNRRIFLHKKFMDCYVGYAKGQLAECAVVPTNRGKGRQELVARYGYDTKFAMHTIRLLESARDFWLTGELEVRRPNREFLISIREGAFKTYTDFKAFAEDLIEKVRIIEQTQKSPLPDEPDIPSINRLVRDIHLSYWSRHPELEC